jgi:hypothetical protein
VFVAPVDTAGRGGAVLGRQIDSECQHFAITGAASGISPDSSFKVTGLPSIARSAITEEEVPAHEVADQPVHRQLLFRDGCDLMTAEFWQHKEVGHVDAETVARALPSPDRA